MRQEMDACRTHCADDWAHEGRDDRVRERVGDGDSEALTAAEAGWRVLRHDLYARIPDANNVAIANSF